MEEELLQQTKKTLLEAIEEQPSYLIKRDLRFFVDTLEKVFLGAGGYSKVLFGVGLRIDNERGECLRFWVIDDDSNNPEFMFHKDLYLNGNVTTLLKSFEALFAKFMDEPVDKSNWKAKHGRLLEDGGFLKEDIPVIFEILLTALDLR